MVTITDNERKVLRAIFTNNFNDSGDYTDMVWTECLNDADEPSGIEGKSLSGVVSSLTKKGLVESSDEGKDSCIWLTDEGVKVAQ